MTERRAAMIPNLQRLYGAPCVLAGAAFAIALVTPPLAAQGEAPALAFQGVTVIDITEGKLFSGQTVVIAGSRIQAVGSADKVDVPAGAHVIDARGKYMLPGFWDMHAHMDDRIEFYPRYIAHGVTGVREMGQRFEGGPDSFRVWQREIMVGARIGPRTVGPSTDLSNDIYSPKVTQPEDTVGLARILDSLKATGTLFLKAHSSTGNPDVFFAILREARRAGLPVVGHVPNTAGNAAAADSGMRNVEHVEENNDCLDDPASDSSSAANSQTCVRMIQAYLRNGTWMTPTAAIYFNPVTAVTSTRRRGHMRAVVEKAYRMGFRQFLAGSDAVVYDPPSINPAGFSILQEIMILAEFGLSPLDALRSATLNPAKYFGATDSLGTIAIGKLADLVLLDADPLADIANVMSIRAVVANGRYFDRATLDTLDPEGLRYARNYREAVTVYRRIPLGAALGVRTGSFPQETGIDGVTGMLIEEVTPASAAQAAGLAVGDFILTVNGRPLKRFWDLPAEERLWEAGAMVTVEVVRDNVRRTLSVKAGDPP